MDIDIRKANTADAKSLSALAEKTFRETYEAFNTKEDMELYIECNFNESTMDKELASTDKVYFLAENNGVGVAYAALDFIKNNEGATIAELSRIYVLNQFKQHRIGSSLVTKCLELANSNGCNKMQLGVWKKNQPAIAFYERKGFKTIGTQTFVLGKDPQEDWIMSLDL